MKSKITLLTVLTTLFVSFQSCKSKKEVEPVYQGPTTYTFDNVDYSGQTFRLDMMGEIIAYCKTGNVANTVLDAQKLKDMYANINNQFSTTELNSSGKKLKDKTFTTEQATIEAYIDSIAEASLSTTPGSEGIAGIITSGTSNRLISGNGVEYVEFIEKGLTGAVLYYQITAVYLGEDKMGAQVAKSDRLHHWDEAFGYLGVPTDFPTNLTGIRYLGKYINARDPLMGSNVKIMNAFILGRTALENDDETVVTSQIAIIRDELEKVMAATAISYMNKAKVGFADDNVRCHTLSEGQGFIKGLLYNPTKKITSAQIEEALGYLQDGGKYNFYKVSDMDMEAIKTLLSNIYGLDSIKNSL